MKTDALIISLACRFEKAANEHGPEFERISSGLIISW